ncbi:bifunctional 23S rRNA (guanine(2069)-N(7))-methyltransferase RlmK/23S rRNA (guanine(2445)-N(2))-methyltransferase RlmL [Neptuniibacter sp. CAU 1671]|uniref:bifunctional 23S rRNA (guanine(2069)-N(7))-methyltransferase RlmK/23S rRNA (guanine(2445)-N(2))-methyltransferase RlmL n=1 Tax=Neptuniibacter sp. CAU 1671 TaxID=3032593 RepID=UPI0023DB9F71|nr:bifunctional 23S rRNA (guanine(2069)-N(7))-methyltransferase RlmK/23S rRNA (guanine(2445)-N(2))-methyltransferase RlmL [Neptuniibacter sp. CAU 1671]MDF2182739.1 bifunctional 23S rRNA (guanine(2069)-N(7))-methyltransferase RlmK/23S rRNA (guanine(2445)-N(2))-methyltransferase RlmL [Neptuniibacter sp. CAU 1671]
MTGTLFVTCPKGLELLLQEELENLGLTELRQTVAGVEGQGGLEAAYQICLWSRLANRVLMPLHECPAQTADELYDGVQAISWLDHINSSGSLLIDFNGRSEGISNTHFGALKVKDAIVDQIRMQTGSRPEIAKVNPDVRVNVYLHRGKARISLDLSGESLHRRAYRLQSGEAPLKENLAAAVLLRAGWPERMSQDMPLIDPMCGSGTLLIEAAMMAADIAPGLSRKRFGFQGWKGHKSSVWTGLVAEAETRKAEGLARLKPLFYGFDQDAKVLNAARQNAARAGVEQAISFETCRLEDLNKARIPEVVGLLVTNPPYGERLGETQQLMFLYRYLGDFMKQQLPGWQAAVLSSNPDLCKVMGLRADKTYKLFNGALESRLVTYPIADKADTREATEQPEETTPLNQSSQMFANRLQKNRKQLARWVKKENIEAYRLYDADMPEYNVAVDIYGDQVHVQEYAPPKKIDPVKAFSRLQDVMHALPVALQVSPEQIVLKQRKRQQGSSQYEKQGESHRFFEVVEHGCRLLVNLHDYLDTGLFLDHRAMRRRVQTESAGKDVLNLFCYTGSVSVHAAVGGARSTTSVDMSATYLNWAKRNLELNGFGGAKHQLVQSDCVKWLHMQRQPAYDLIFLDPPTFSNSKRMQGVFDVQRDHVELIQQAMRILRPGGVLYFSNNFRQFKLDHDALSDFTVTDITGQSLDPDFKGQTKVHVCFRIMQKDEA